MSAVLLLLISFFVQPFHQAAAAEPLPEETESDLVPGTAAEVRDHSEDAEDEVINNIDQSELESMAEELTTDEEVVNEEPETEADEGDIQSGEDQETEEGVGSTDSQDASASSTVVDIPQTEQASSTDTATENYDGSVAQSTSTPTTGGESDTQAGDDVASSTSTTSTAIEDDVAEPVDESATTTATTSVSSEQPGSGSSSQDDTVEPNEPEVVTPNNDNDEPLGPATPPSTDSTDDPAEQEPQATTTDETENQSSSTPRVIENRVLVNDDNFFQFDRQSCVAVGDGTFHCTNKSADDVDSSSVVYAEIGDNGSSDIFMKTKRGDVKQLSANINEDTAPFYDPETFQVVWQRSIDGRQQVILYDIESEREVQLTFSRTNNMEPKVSAEGIVWQAWDGNDWEIMYFDGVYTEQITDNNGQDVTPVIEDDYILWSVLGGEDQEARVYSLSSKEILTISGHEGGAIANPRFILVYDTMFENGDVVTQGFDPVTGLSAPIAAQPAPEPVEIPTPDPLGEISALINNKSPHEDEGELTVDYDTAQLNPDRSTSSDDIVLDLADPQVSDVPATTTSPALELTEYDLILIPSSHPELQPEATTTDEESSTQE